MRKIFGAMMLLLAVVLIGWMVYIFFIEVPKPGEKQPNPIAPIGFVGGLIYVGLKWIKGETAK